MSTSFGFSIKKISICLFQCQKTAFVCEFQHTPLCKMTFFSSSIHLMDMRFCWHVPNSFKNKNLKSFNPYLLLKVVFWPLKLCYIQLYFSTLNLIILQMVWNKYVRFGGHMKKKKENSRRKDPAWMKCPFALGPEHINI